MYKNLVINAFGDLVERTDYGNHKNQLNLFDNLDEELSYLDSLLTTGFNLKKIKKALTFTKIICKIK